MVREVTPTEFLATLADRPETLLIDVREPWELDIARLPAAINIPMGQVPDRLGDIDRTRDVVIMCRSGGRSLTVARFLEGQGYPTVMNLSGGILAWREQLDPSLATY